MFKKNKVLIDEIYHLAELDGGKFSVCSIKEAYAFCKKIAVEHYENFPVGSVLLPRKLRKHFYSIYAFSRVADDIGDEIIKFSTVEYAKNTLNKYKTSLEAIYSNKNIYTSNPIFLALRNTVHEFNIPISPFIKLISAFERDISFEKFQKFDDLLEYCDNSANPIGELILRLFGEFNKNNLKYSNKICSALQLINFWQDISVDININRVYIPQEVLNTTDNKSQIVKLLLDYTENMMVEGALLLDNIRNYRLKLELSAIISGGNLLIDKIKKEGENIFFNRPKITKQDALKLFYKSLMLMIQPKI